MATRALTRLLSKITAGNFQPDTGLTVLLVDILGGATLATAVETPAASGNYVATFTPTPKLAYWKVGAVTKSDWGMVWMGIEGQLRPTYIFKKVKFYDPADTPTGAKSAAKTFTSNTAPLATSEGYSIQAFTNVPMVCIGKLYQEREVFISTDPALSGSNVTFGTSVGDAGDNNGDGNCYADIVIISLD